MEVLIQGREGIPESSILSIRCGATRRQAPISSIDKPFRFPCKPEDCAALKIDIFQHVAAARTVTRAGTSDHKLMFEAVSDAGTQKFDSNLELSFQVRPSTKDSKHMGDGLVQSARRREAEASMDKYLDDHNVPAFLQGILQGLVKEKPGNPYTFIAAQFAAEAEKAKFVAQVQASRSPRGTPRTLGKLNVPGASPTGHPENLQKSLDEARKESTVLKQQLDNVQNELAQRAKENSELKKLFKEDGEVDVTAPREETIEQQAEKIRDLEIELDQVMKEAADVISIKEDGISKLKGDAAKLESKYREQQIQWELLLKQKDDQLAALMTSKEAENLRLQARGFFVEGLRTGALQESVEKTLQPDGTRERREPVLSGQIPIPNAVDISRTTARETLIDAANDGQLIEALKGIRQENEGDARKAFGILSKSGFADYYKSNMINAITNAAWQNIFNRFAVPDTRLAQAKQLQEPSEAVESKGAAVSSTLVPSGAEIAILPFSDYYKNNVLRSVACNFPLKLDAPMPTDRKDTGAKVAEDTTNSKSGPVSVATLTEEKSMDVSQLDLSNAQALHVELEQLAKDRAVLLEQVNAMRNLMNEVVDENNRLLKEILSKPLTTAGEQALLTSTAFLSTSGTSPST